MVILFACERFNQYLHGRETITVSTDHKPLVPIFTKSIFKAPKQLQRMILRLQKYSLKVQYCPGSQMYIADMLSRAYLKESVSNMTPDYQIFQLIHKDSVFQDIEDTNFMEYLRMSEATHAQIKQYTQTDTTLQALLTTILAGWPSAKEEVPICIRMFWGYRDEVTAQNGVLYKGSRIIIPKLLQKQMLLRTHSSHQGAEACIGRARDVIFWPGMTAEIKDMVSQCSTCAAFQVKQQKEPLMTHKIPARPWKMVAQDLFTHGKKDYLITTVIFGN